MRATGSPDMDHRSTQYSKGSPGRRWLVAGRGGSGVFLVLVFLMGGCQPRSESPAIKTAKSENAEAAPTNVRTTNATERLLPRYLRVTGELQGMQDAQVAADTEGKVTEAPVERGSLVKAGDILAKVDERTAEISLREAEASVALARARLALARNEAERNAPLVETKAIADADFRKLEADQAAREAELAIAVAQCDLARKTLADSVIRAPFAGLVAERYVQPGEYVSANTRIARVVEVTRLRLVLNVPETAVGRVREGQSVEFTTAASPGDSFTGIIRFIGGAVRESARDLIVEAEVQNEDGRLKPGLFADARVRVGEAQVVALPTEALRSEGNRRSVFLIENGALVERLVEVGETFANWFEVRSGLKAGETVVLSPGREAADGRPAKVIQP
jgi:membrane fusion protein, multidrug efflux system